MDDHLKDQAKMVTSALSRIIRRFFTIDADDPATELPVAQIRVCSILRDGPRTMSALSHDLGISLSAITQIADRLERAGLVERTSMPKDRRVKSLRLTAYGVDVIGRRVEKRVGRIFEALMRMPPDSREAVLMGLHTLLESGHGSHVSDGSPMEPLM